MTTEEIIKNLKDGKVANLGPHYTPEELLPVIEDVKKEVPTARVTRRPAAGDWLVYLPR